ncbi:hypothetical protein [Thiobacillus sedimenti]|uniref:Uncharacterized protein n=1 Tax=Thiobacillus sedimenti TaxID=3110231 RepID=A0ABZ1CJL2_9PROT|nr:hypothetical protein [Thiobacillus sp. SCUT-2]WRS39570.1 hypothetical protein VA613_01500 [Thiobacillus sp. SCUT-2]
MSHVTLLLLAAAALLAATAARSDPLPAPGASPPAAFSAAVPDSELAGNRGGTTTISNLNDLNASVYNNTALDSVTGSNYVTDGALTGNSGFSTVIQNSGNNVLIQNATILNLQVQ